MVLPAFSGCTIPGLGNGGLIQRNPGDAAKDIVSGSTYSRLVVEIDYEVGGDPNSEAVNLMENRLLANTGKIDIDVVKEAGVAGKGAGAKYTFDEVNRLMQGARSRSTGGDTAVIHVLYVNGGSTTDQGSSQVLGAAYCATCIVMFKGNIRENTRSDGSLPITGKPEEKLVESAVLVHEVGHIMGLVNVGTPMVTPHEDSAHKGHSISKQSVMYWEVDSTRLLTAFGLDDIPDDFDQNDKADLCGVSGRCP
ncbi:MAG: hypothetical protein HY556_04480 [Euryarchaeota archaeon]|nr:hypothetical protein [Euryarchaeota archaeon]